MVKAAERPHSQMRAMCSLTAWWRAKRPSPFWILASAGLALAASVTAALWPAAAVPKDLLLVYVGADDCRPCRNWQSGEGARFRAAPDFSRIPYREVKAATLRDVLKDEVWPQDLRGYRDQLGAGAGVPMWLIIADGRVVDRSFGESQWRTGTLPKLKTLLR
jgi:hypothetical protein